MDKVRKISIRLCPICSNNSCEVLHIQKFVLSDDHPLRNGYDVVYCERCGFIFADTIISEQDYDLFYANCSIYGDNNTSTGGGNTPLDAERLKQTAEYVASFLPDKEARIMDIGCANGGLLIALKQIGYCNLVGIDPSPICVSNTIKSAGVQAFVGSLPGLKDIGGKYDCVILSHVMEHLHNLQKAVVCIKNLMTESGLIYVEVPDATKYAEYLCAPFQDFNTEHINHFSATSLLNLFSTSGFVSLDQVSRTICIAQEIRYPVIRNMFKMKYDNKAEILKDIVIYERIKEYIKGSQCLMNKMNRRIKTILGKTNEIIVWGTGQLTMKLLAETCLNEAKVVFFVDGNPVNQGKILNGIEIKSPNQIVGFDYPILIASTIHQREIEYSIKQMGLPNKLFGLDLGL